MLDYWSTFQYKDVIQHGQLHVKKRPATGFISFNMEIMPMLVR